MGDLTKCQLRMLAAVRDAPFGRLRNHWELGATFWPNSRWRTALTLRMLERLENKGLVGTSFEPFCGGPHYHTVAWLTVKGEESITRKGDTS